MSVTFFRSRSRRSTLQETARPWAEGRCDRDVADDDSTPENRDLRPAGRRDSVSRDIQDREFGLGLPRQRKLGRRNRQAGKVKAGQLERRAAVESARPRFERQGRLPELEAGAEDIQSKRRRSDRRSGDCGGLDLSAEKGGKEF